jgi:hypothetical protein
MATYTPINALPNTNPRCEWTDPQFVSAVTTAQTALQKVIDAAKAAHTYTGPGALGDVYSVYAGLAANYKTAYPNHAPLPKLNS